MAKLKAVKVAPIQSTGGLTRYFYSDDVSTFLMRDDSSILGILATANTFSLDTSQRDAWLVQIQVLKATLTALRTEGHVYFEY